jgi:hypothetical protein
MSPLPGLDQPPTPQWVLHPTRNYKSETANAKASQKQIPHSHFAQSASGFGMTAGLLGARGSQDAEEKPQGRHKTARPGLQEPALRGREVRGRAKLRYKGEAANANQKQIPRPGLGMIARAFM